MKGARHFCMNYLHPASLSCVIIHCMKPENIIPLNLEKAFRADAVRNRRTLMDTANRLFQAAGVETVTMSMVAKEAGVGKGTLYRHFPDKAALCHALLDEDMRDFQQATLTQLRMTPNPVSALKWFLQSAFAYVDGHSALLYAAARQSGAQMLSHPAHLWWWQTIQGLLLRLQLTGDVDYLADSLYIMLDVNTIRFQLGKQNYDDQRLVAGLHRLVDNLLAENS
jgi:AcrR family transcriptional regulator